MTIQIIALGFLIGAIAIGFIKKINVGIAAFGLVLLLALIGGLKLKVIFAGFPTKLFITLLGTMFFFALLQENKTLELLSQKIIAAVGKNAFLIPIILYVTAYALSAAGPGAISAQAVTILFAVTLAVQMKVDPLLLATPAFLGAVGGTASPIALTGIIISDLFAAQNISVPNSQWILLFGITAVNFLCALVTYIWFKGYRLSPDDTIRSESLPAFNNSQKMGLASLLFLVCAVVLLKWDVGLVSFTLGFVLVLFGAANEQKAIKLIQWNVLILISGVSVLMNVTQELGGIALLSNMHASVMNKATAPSVMALTGGILSWFSSANGVVFPTLIPTLPRIAQQLGSGMPGVMEMTMGIVGAATIAGISPLSTGGSLILAVYSQEARCDVKEQQKLFARCFILSFCFVAFVAVIAAFIFKPICG